MRRAGWVALTLPFVAGARRAPPVPPPDADAVAGELVAAALASAEPWEELVELADTIGHRISGSPQLERAVAWGAAQMAADGLTVTTEPVSVPHWARGPASLHVELPWPPFEDEIDLLALGNSVATPPEGLRAPVLVVGSFEELTARAAEAAGKVVVYDVPFTDYGATVRYRTQGASEASRVGAVAALVRSVTTASLDTPHTGNQRYAEGVTPIPVAAITVEDSAKLHRLQERGVSTVVRLRLDAAAAGEKPSHNVVGELRGRDLPGEVVVLGCHLDSWDVGQGAQDDGAGCVTVMQAGALLRALPVAPRRTVRVVLFTNEENGLRGGKAYLAAHASERVVFAVEDDSGAGVPLGLEVEARLPDGGDDHARMEAFRAGGSRLLGWLAPLGAGAFTGQGSGADISPWVAAGAFGLGLHHDMTGYWPIHHTDADTLDKIDPAVVRRNAAAMAVTAWYLAEVAEVPPRGPAPDPEVKP
jgi:carboxypeptidase Q